MKIRALLDARNAFKRAAHLNGGFNVAANLEVNGVSDRGKTNRERCQATARKVWRFTLSGGQSQGGFHTGICHLINFYFTIKLFISKIKDSNY
jgi:hypothetical protein